MKKTSKKATRNHSLADDNKKTFVNVSKIGNFNRSSHLHSSYVAQDYAVIVQGNQPKGSQSELICKYLANSLNYFLANIVTNMDQEQKLCQKTHIHRLTNLLTSCREYIQQNKMNGSFSFCFYYKIHRTIFCMKSFGLEMYCLNIQSSKIIPLAASQIFPFRVKQNQQQAGYFYSGMSKIKPQYMLQDQELLSFSSFKPQNQSDNYLILIGSSECFALLTHEYVIKHFSQQNKSLWDTSQALLQQVNKKWRKIYQKDITFICFSI